MIQDIRCLNIENRFDDLCAQLIAEFWARFKNRTVLEFDHVYKSLLDEYKVKLSISFVMPEEETTDKIIRLEGCINKQLIKKSKLQHQLATEYFDGIS